MLLPTTARFAWVVCGNGYNEHLENVELRLAGRPDSADTHIQIILKQENGHSAQNIQEKDDGAGSDDADGQSDDDYAGSSGLTVGGAEVETDHEGEGIDLEEDPMVKEELLGKRSLEMRMANMKIQAAVDAAPSGVLHLKYLQFTNHLSAFISEHDRLVAGLEGIEFPIGTPTVEWPAHGIRTFKPFTNTGGPVNKVYSSSLFLNVTKQISGWRLG